LEAQNASLSAEVAQYQERAAAYDTLLSENAALGQMVHLAATSPGITAPIVSSFNASPYGTFLVGAGAADTIAAGDLVLTDTNFVIGRVVSVNAHTSLVDEVLAPNTFINVIVDGASVPADGEGGGNAQARLPLGVNVNVGDSVIAPQYGGRAIGVVGHVTSDQANGYSQIYIALPVDLSALRFVYITQ
jgi:cell shape-determining protein MreC